MTADQHRIAGAGIDALQHYFWACVLYSAVRPAGIDRVTPDSPVTGPNSWCPDVVDCRGVPGPGRFLPIQRTLWQGTHALYNPIYFGRCIWHLKCIRKCNRNWQRKWLRIWLSISLGNCTTRVRRQVCSVDHNTESTRLSE